MVVAAERPPARPGRSERRVLVTDLAYVVLTLVVFGLLAALLRGLERL